MDVLCNNLSPWYNNYAGQESKGDGDHHLGAGGSR